MRRYETLFIVDPELTDENLKEVAEKFKNIILADKGHIIKYDEWGKRKLAYPVGKHDYGFYILLDYCGPSDIVNELERNMRIDERVLKYITVKISDSFDQEDLEEIKEAEKPAEIPQEAEKAEEVAAQETIEESSEHEKKVGERVESSESKEEKSSS
ncbi:MAG TPA: 30S ribosomal protein S6 [Deltaproteobacteria bacterium]|nr:30S ribosomal protein S6 [Deltaproteobacteria bacterium]